MKAMLQALTLLSLVLLATYVVNGCSHNRNDAQNEEKIGYGFEFRNHKFVVSDLDGLTMDSELFHSGGLLGDLLVTLTDKDLEFYGTKDHFRMLILESSSEIIPKNAPTGQIDEWNYWYETDDVGDTKVSVYVCLVKNKFISYEFGGVQSTIPSDFIRVIKTMEEIR